MDSIVPGSIAAVAGKKEGAIAKAMLGVKFALCLDNSGSSNWESHTPGKSRWEVENDVLAKSQNDHPGKIAVFTFGEMVEFCAGGVMRSPNGTTSISPLLEFSLLARAAKSGIKIIIISDGEVGDDDEALEIAKSFPKGSISTICVGPKGSDGEKFLAELARTCGGVSENSELAETKLFESIERLLLGAGN